MNKKQNKPDSFAVFALICMGITIVATMLNELVLWLSR